LHTTPQTLYIKLFDAGQHKK